MIPEHVEKTIAELEEKAGWHRGRAALMLAEARDLRCIFDPEAMKPAESPVESSSAEPDPPSNQASCPSKQADSPSKDDEKPQVGRRKSRHASSKYKGVTKGTRRLDGTFRWKAQYWAGPGKKIKFLGSFEIEEEAAAAVAEARGDKDEAARLRQLAADIREQAENNPASPKPIRASGVYECGKCRHQHIVVKRKPAKCESCGSENLKRIA